MAPARSIMCRRRLAYSPVRRLGSLMGVTPMIRFECPTCGKHVKASEPAAGGVGKCPRCGERIRIPGPQEGDSPTASQVHTMAPAAVNPPAPGNIPASPEPPTEQPSGGMILCYACKKPVADTAQCCPRCGALQTPEGRQKGRQLKKQADWFTTITGLVICVPCFICCVGIMISKSGPPPVPTCPICRQEADAQQLDRLGCCGWCFTQKVAPRMADEIRAGER